MKTDNTHTKRAYGKPSLKPIGTLEQLTLARKSFPPGKQGSGHDNKDGTYTKTPVNPPNGE